MMMADEREDKHIRDKSPGKTTDVSNDW